MGRAGPVGIAVERVCIFCWAVGAAKRSSFRFALLNVYWTAWRAAVQALVPVAADQTSSGDQWIMCVEVQLLDALPSEWKVVRCGAEYLTHVGTDIAHSFSFYIKSFSNNFTTCIQSLLVHIEHQIHVIRYLHHDSQYIAFILTGRRLSCACFDMC